MSIEAQVIGDKEVVANMGVEMRAYMDAARKAVRRVGLRHESVIKTDKLSGQVLHRRSGRLSAGVHTNFVDTEDSSSAVTGIGEALMYGKMHELGGVYTVKEHLRIIHQAFGRPINPTTVTVKQHTITLPVRSWLRSTLREQASKDIETIREEVAKANK